MLLIWNRGLQTAVREPILSIMKKLYIYDYETFADLAERVTYPETITLRMPGPRTFTENLIWLFDKHV